MPLQHKIAMIPWLPNDQLLHAELSIRKEWLSALTVAGLNSVLFHLLPKMLSCLVASRGGPNLLRTTIHIWPDINTWEDALQYLEQLRGAIHARGLMPFKFDTPGRVDAVLKGIWSTEAVAFINHLHAELVLVARV